MSKQPLKTNFSSSSEHEKSKTKAEQCVEIVQHLSFIQDWTNEALAIDLIGLPDDEIEKVFNCLPPGNPLEGLNQEALLARNRRIKGVWLKANEKFGIVWLSSNLDKFRFLVKELGLCGSEIPRENWKTEGRCPQCGELGPFLRGAPCCSQHGPYWF